MLPLTLHSPSESSSSIWLHSHCTRRRIALFAPLTHHPPSSYSICLHSHCIAVELLYLPPLTLHSPSSCSICLHSHCTRRRVALFAFTHASPAVELLLLFLTNCFIYNKLLCSAHEYISRYISNLISLVSSLSFNLCTLAVMDLMMS